MAETPGFGRLRWALLGSLAVNLLLVGAIAGALLTQGPRRPPPGPMILHYARSLPEPYRDDLVSGLRSTRRDWSAAREMLEGQRDALAEALVAEPYDPAAVAAVLARETTVMGELATRGTRLLLDQIKRMGPAERAAYAKALRDDPGIPPPPH